MSLFFSSLLGKIPKQTPQQTLHNIFRQSIIAHLSSTVFRLSLQTFIASWLENDDSIDVDIYVSNEFLNEEYAKCVNKVREGIEKYEDKDLKEKFGVTLSDAVSQPELEAYQKTVMDQLLKEYLDENMSRIQKCILQASSLREEQMETGSDLQDCNTPMEIFVDGFMQNMKQLTHDNWIEVLKYMPHDALSDLRDLRNAALACKASCHACKSISMAITGIRDSPDTINLKCKLFTVDTLIETTCEQAESVIHFGTPHTIKNISWWSRGSEALSNYHKMISRFTNLEHIGPCFNRLNLVNSFDPLSCALPSVKSVFISFSDNKHAHNALSFWGNLLVASSKTLRRVRVHYPPHELMQHFLKAKDTIEEMFIIPRANTLDEHEIQNVLQFSNVKRLTLKSCGEAPHANLDICDCVRMLANLPHLEELNVSLTSSLCRQMVEPFLNELSVKRLGLYRIYFPLPGSVESLTLLVPRSEVDWGIVFELMPNNLTSLTIILEPASQQDAFFAYFNRISRRLHKLQKLVIVTEGHVSLRMLTTPMRSVQQVAFITTSEYVKVRRTTLFYLMEMFPKSQLVADPHSFSFDKVEDDELLSCDNRFMDNYRIYTHFMMNISLHDWRTNLTNLYTQAERNYFPKSIRQMCELDTFKTFPQARVHPQYWLPLGEFDGVPKVLLD
mmetsp:Transcript_10230/g.37999  ORF Transcript_10230/g.37999 Transcript_10230/m.37999 type:complete len:672 (-) Transcript_10230:144-2159(-)